MPVKFAVLLFGLICFTNVAHGWNPSTECPSSPEDSLEAQKLAGKLFAAGDASYKNSQPIEALKRFLCSHSIIQHENTLFNIAQIAKLNATREQALALLTDYVTNSRGSNKVDPIRDIIDDINKEIAEDPNAKSAVVEEPTPAPQESAAAEPANSETPTEDKKGMKVAGLALMGAGGAGVIAGGVLQVLAGAAKSDAEGSSNYSQFKDDKEKMTSFQLGAYVGFAVGGTFAATGMVLYLLGKRKESASVESAVSVMPAPGGLTIRGRF